MKQTSSSCYLNEHLNSIILERTIEYSTTQPQNSTAKESNATYEMKSTWKRKSKVTCSHVRDVVRKCDVIASPRACPPYEKSLIKLSPRDYNAFSTSSNAKKCLVIRVCFSPDNRTIKINLSSTSSPSFFRQSRASETCM